MPWTSKDAQRHTKKARSPKAQRRQWAHVSNSALARGASEGSAIRQANSVVARRHAAGGAISPLASLVGNPMRMRSSLPHLGQPMGSAGRARMPHVPLADTMHNIDQHMAGARAKLPRLRTRSHFNEGGEVQSPPSMTDEEINALLRAAQMQIATNPQAATEDHSNLRALIAYMAQRAQNRGAAGPPPHFAEGGDTDEVRYSSSPGSPGVSGAVKDALAALKDYMVDRPRRELAAARREREDKIEEGQEPEPNYAGGGAVMLGKDARGAVKAALTHLANKDASSAAATLHASPEAMQHPVVRLAAHALRSGAGLAPATQQLAAMRDSMPQR